MLELDRGLNTKLFDYNFCLKIRLCAEISMVCYMISRIIHAF